MQWKKNEIEELRKLYPTNFSLSIIANKLKRSIKSITHKAARLNLSRPNLPINKPHDLNHRNKYDKRYYEKNKERIYDRKMKRRLKLKEELISLLGGKCKICGYNKSLAAMDFHHNKENKEFSIAVLLKNSSRQKILKEAEKCILLCANCHRELHYKGL
jgi:predicted HNH restriction endonuclease